MSQKNKAAQLTAATVIATTAISALSITPALANEDATAPVTQEAVVPQVPAENAALHAEIEEIADMVSEADLAAQEAAAAQAAAAQIAAQEQANLDAANQAAAAAQAALDAAANTPEIIAAQEVVDNSQQNVTNTEVANVIIEGEIEQQKTVVVDATNELNQTTEERDAAQQALDAATEKAETHDIDTLEANKAQAEAAHTQSRDVAQGHQEAHNETVDDLQEAADKLTEAIELAGDANDPEKIAEAAEAAAAAITEYNAATTDLPEAERAYQEALAAWEAAAEALEIAINDEGSSDSQLRSMSQTKAMLESELSSRLNTKLQTEAQIEIATQIRDAADSALVDAQAEKTQSEASLVDAATSIDEILAAIAEVQVVADSATAAAVNSERLLALGAAGYFESISATDALRVLTDPTVTALLDSTEINAENDATQIDELIRSLEFIAQANEIRESIGLAPLAVSNTLMAVGMVNANHAVVDFSHSNQFTNISENLAAGFSGEDDPFQVWYTLEKQMFDEAVASGQYPGIESMTNYQIATQYPELFMTVGHYLNIIDPSATLTGFGSAGGTQAQIFSAGGSVVGANGTRLATNADGDARDMIQNVSEYLATLNADIDAKNEALADLADLQARLAQAREYQAQVQDRVNTANTTLADAEAAVVTTNTDLANAIANLQVETADIDRLNGSIADLTASLVTQREAHAADAAKLVEAQITADATSETTIATAQVLSDAQERLVEAENNRNSTAERVSQLADAQAVVEAAEAAHEEATNANAEAQQILAESRANVEATLAQMTTSQNALAAAQADISELPALQEALDLAQTSVENAEAKLTSEQSTLDELFVQQEGIQSDIADAITTLEEAQAALVQAQADAVPGITEAQAAVDAAQADVDAAQAVLDAALAALDTADADVAAAQIRLEQTRQMLVNAQQGLADLEAAQAAAAQAAKDAEAAAAAAQAAANQPGGIASAANVGVGHGLVASGVTTGTTGSETTSNEVLATTGTNGVTSMVLGASTMLLLGAGALMAARRKAREA